MRGQDLLHDHIDRSADGNAEIVQILFWVEKTVDVIEPYSLQLALFDHRQEPTVRALEHRRHLHAQARKIVDVKEAPVVDLVAGDEMGGHSPRLLADQRIEGAPVAVERREAGVEFLARFFILSSERRQIALERLRALGDLRPPVWQVEE